MDNLDDAGLLAALMDAAVDAIVVTDGEGRIVRANRAATVMFQRDETDLSGRDVGVLMPNAMAMLHGGFMAEHVKTGARSILDTSRAVEGIRADGSTVPLLLSVGRADTAHGIAFVSIMRDLTEQRAMEAASARSQRMDAIGRMTGGIAHDFNNLLTVVIGNLELLSGVELTERQRNFLDDALAAAELGADLTARLTIFARTSDTYPEAIDLNTQLEKALALLRHTIGAHCKISSRSEPDLRPIAADATQLQTAILNLAMNAQDAMQEGGRLVLETANVDIDDTYVAQELNVAPGHYVRLSVTDTGHGMGEEQKTHAIEPFYTTKAPGQGTGLGLSMVYGFIKQSGGHLTIYSEPGNGTTVSLYFPALEPDVEATEPETRVHKTRPDGDARTILIVEDDARLRHLTEQRLIDLGFKTKTARSADEAWDLLEAGLDAALVFTDLVMPGGMSGFDLAQRIASERPDIAVLLTSGFSETVLPEAGQGKSFAILRKPYRQADLERAVYAVLEAI